MCERWKPRRPPSPQKSGHFRAQNRDRNLEGRKCDLQDFGPFFSPENGLNFLDPARPAVSVGREGTIFLYSLDLSSTLQNLICVLQNSHIDVRTHRDPSDLTDCWPHHSDSTLRTDSPQLFNKRTPDTCEKMHSGTAVRTTFGGYVGRLVRSLWD